MGDVTDVVVNGFLSTAQVLAEVECGRNAVVWGIVSSSNELEKVDEC